MGASMRRIIYGISVLTMLSSPVAVQAEHVRHSFRHEVAVLGMGGAYTAGEWRGTGLFYNPASLARERFHLNIPIRIEAGGTGGLGHAKTVVDYFRNNREALEALSELSSQQAGDLDRQTEKLHGTGGIARVLPAVRIGRRNFSLQTYGVLDGTPRMTSGVFQPRLDLTGFADIGAIAGYGRSFKYRDRRFSLGVSIKGFRRWPLLTSFSLEESAEGPESFREVGNAVQNDPHDGIGVDIGARVPFGRNFALGVTAQDAFTFLDVEPEMSLNAGMYCKLLPRVHFVADYRDVLNKSDTPAPMHLHFGAEMDLTLLRFRVGAYQGYPTFGLGLNLWLVKLDVVYYQQEGGNSLGELTETALALELQFGVD